MTFEDVVAELGGVAEVGRIVNQPSAAVCNWKRRRRRFPSRYTDALRAALDARGASAPADLFGQVGSHKL